VFAEEKEKEWQKRIDELPDPKEFDALLKEAEGLEFSSKDPIETLKNFRRLEKIVKQAEANIDTYEKTHKDLKKDFSKLDSDVSSIDDLV
jgi:predicted  nucleic acid-binding Zn-ribbon protein